MSKKVHRTECRRGHRIEGANAYKRPDGYVECRHCRDFANKKLRKRVQAEPLTMELVRHFEHIFWKRAKKSAGCWLWQGAPCGGYGYFRFAGHKLSPNRFALALKLGRLPTGLACHACDVPLCVRTTHLYEGTPATNANDMTLRGRAPRGETHWSHRTPERVKRGARHGRAKLNESAVRDIRAQYASRSARQHDLAKQFGVTPSLISQIVLGKIWKSVPLK